MTFRYLDWDEQRHGDARPSFAKLLDLFNELLLHTGGDVEEAIRWLTQLDERYGLGDEEYGIGDFIEDLKKQEYLKESPGGLVELTARAEKGLRQRSLEEIFSHLKKGAAGGHRTPFLGAGTDKMPESRSWRFGDEVHRLDVTATLGNAFRRTRGRDLVPGQDDFQVYETDYYTSSATVLMIDLSHSMVLYGEDRITPARKTAMALVELIMTRYPKDSVDIVAFGDDAWQVEVKDLPYLQVGPYHTNTRSGLQRARTILQRRKNRNKQIFLITDGKPSAQYESDGRLYKNPYGLDRRIVNRVLDEAVMCRREGVTITTFMIARDSYLQQFVRRLTEANQGRAYYASLDNLGEYLFEDFVRNRKRKTR